MYLIYNSYCETCINDISYVSHTQLWNVITPNSGKFVFYVAFSVPGGLGGTKVTCILTTKFHFGCDASWAGALNLGDHFCTYRIKRYDTYSMKPGISFKKDHV